MSIWLYYFIINYVQEVETTPAYPDICFAVDDFDSTFDAVVMFLIDLMWIFFIKYICKECLLKWSFHDLWISFPVMIFCAYCVCIYISEFVSFNVNTHWIIEAVILLIQLRSIGFVKLSVFLLLRSWQRLTIAIVYFSMHMMVQLFPQRTMQKIAILVILWPLVWILILKIQRIPRFGLLLFPVV